MMESERVMRVSDIAGSGDPLPGEKVKVSELVDTEFVITRVDERDGDWGPYLAVAIEVQGKEYYFFSNHQVIMSKLQKCVGQFPLLATVVARAGQKSGMTYFDIG